MTQSLFIRLIFLFMFVFAFGKNTEAAISTAFQKIELHPEKAFSKNRKQKKTWRLWKKLKAKFAKANDKVRGKNHFGKIGLLVFLGGLVLAPVSASLFLLGLLGCFVFGIIGLIEDEKIGLAIFAILLPIVFILLTLLLLLIIISSI